MPGHVVSFVICQGIHHIHASRQILNHISSTALHHILLALLVSTERKTSNLCMQSLPHQQFGFSLGCKECFFCHCNYRSYLVQLIICTFMSWLTGSDTWRYCASFSYLLIGIVLLMPSLPRNMSLCQYILYCGSEFMPMMILIPNNALISGADVLTHLWSS